MGQDAEPRRAHVLKLDMGSDDLRMLIADIHGIAERLERGELTRGCMGGSTSGYSYEYSVDESWTHDRYFDAINETLRAKEPHP